MCPFQCFLPQKVVSIRGGGRCLQRDCSARIYLYADTHIDVDLVYKAIWICTYKIVLGLCVFYMMLLQLKYNTDQYTHQSNRKGMHTSKYVIYLHIQITQNTEGNAV